MIPRPVLAAALWASAVFAQGAPAERVFTFAGADSPQTMQEIVNTLRAVAMNPLQSSAEVKDQAVSFDSAQGRLTVQGSAANVDVAQWVFELLETASLGPNRREYVVPGSSDDVVLVSGPSNVADMRQLQELVNALRSIAEIQRVTAFSPQKSITVRGQGWQIELAEWLIEHLDNPPAGQSLAAYTIAGPPSTLPNGRPFPSGAPFPTAVRIFYRPRGTTPEALQQTVSTARAEAQIMRIVSYSAQQAVALRGSDSEVAAAEQLLESANR